MLKSFTKSSSMRFSFIFVVISAGLISLLSVLFNFIISLLIIYIPDTFLNSEYTLYIDLSQIAFLVSALLLPAFGGKTGQSFAERKDIISSEDKGESTK